METNDIVKWKQTAPGIWTRVPDAEPAAARKSPVRKISSLLANPPPPGEIPPAGQHRFPSPPAAVVRR